MDREMVRGILVILSTHKIRCRRSAEAAGRVACNCGDWPHPARVGVGGLWRPLRRTEQGF